jgi:hypothetical protein
MSDIIERVAKAIDERDSIFIIPYGIRPSDLRLLARAAIEALRDPGGAEMAPGPVAYTAIAGSCRPVAFRAGWNAVISAALQPATDTGEAK